MKSQTILNVLCAVAISTSIRMVVPCNSANKIPEETYHISKGKITGTGVADTHTKDSMITSLHKKKHMA